MEFVDRYFMAILSEAMQDGLVKGYLDGDGKTWSNQESSVRSEQ